MSAVKFHCPIGGCRTEPFTLRSSLDAHLRARHARNDDEIGALVVEAREAVDEDAVVLPYPCVVDGCGMRFKSPQALGGHMKRHAVRPPAEPAPVAEADPVVTLRKRFVCMNCDAERWDWDDDAGKRWIAEHVAAAHPSFDCDLCGGTWPTEPDVEQHNMEAHCFACPTCHQIIDRDETAIAAHVLAHLPVCVCGARFPDIDALVEHAKSHEPAPAPEPPATADLLRDLLGRLRGEDPYDGHGVRDDRPEHERHGSARSVADKIEAYGRKAIGGGERPDLWFASTWFGDVDDPVEWPDDLHAARVDHGANDGDDLVVYYGERSWVRVHLAAWDLATVPDPARRALFALVDIVAQTIPNSLRPGA